MYTITRLRALMLVAAAAFLHVTVVRFIAIRGAAPDLTFSVVVFFGLFARRRIAVEAAFAAGLVRDLFSAKAFGAAIAVYVATALCASVAASHVYRESRLSQGLVVVFFSLAASSAQYLFLRVAASAARLVEGCFPPYLGYLTRSALPDALYTGIVSVILFRWLMRWCRVERRIML